jgi:hypothetical protein
MELVKILCFNKKSVQQNIYQYRKSYIKIVEQLFRALLLNQKQFQIKISNLILLQKYLKLNLLNKQYLLLSPKIFTEFIKKQLKLTNLLNIKQNNFGNSLQNKLLKLIQKVIYLFKYDILGIKIICV